MISDIKTGIRVEFYDKNGAIRIGKITRITSNRVTIRLVTGTKVRIHVEKLIAIRTPKRRTFVNHKIEDRWMSKEAKEANR